MKTFIDNDGFLRHWTEDTNQFLMSIPPECLDPWLSYDSWEIDLAVKLITIGYNLDLKECIEDAKEYPHQSSGSDMAHACREVFERGMSIAKSSIAAGLLKSPDTPENWLAWAARKGYSVAHLTTTAPSGTPESDSHQEKPWISAGRNDSTGMVAWQADIIENKDAILKEYGNAVSARQIMLWCKTKGSIDVFKRDQPKNRDSLQWIDSYAGDVHTVTYKTISNQLSAWRAQGIFPPIK